MRLRRYDKEWLEKLCAESYSLAEVLKKAGRRQSGGNQETLKKKILEFNIDISHFTGMLWSKGKTAKNNASLRKMGITHECRSEQEVLCLNSKVSQSCLRKYIIRHQSIPYICQCCSCDGNWYGKQISLELDHINGNNKDNRIENLRWLCPNCHSATPTYCRKKDRVKKEPISEEQIINALKSTSNIHQALLYCNLSGYGDNYTRFKKVKEKYNI